MALGQVSAQLHRFRSSAHPVRIDVRALLEQIGNRLGVVQDDHFCRQYPQIKNVRVLDGLL